MTKKNIWDEINRKEIIYLLPTLIWIVAMTILNYTSSSNIINSDMSAELVLGRELANTNRIFTTQWYYSTEVRIFYTQIISMILFHFISSWSLVRALTNGIFMLGLLAAYLFAVRPMNLKKKARYLSSMFLFIPYSLEYAGIVQIGNSYMPHFIVVFVGIGLLLRLLEKNNRLLLGLLVGISFYAGLCGIRYLTILALPMGLAAILKMIINNRPENVKAPILGLISCVCGVLVNQKIFPLFLSVGGQNALQMNEFSSQGILGTADYLLVSILRLFGYRDLEYLGSLNGIASLCAIVMMVAFGIIIGKMICRYPDMDEKKQMFFLFFAMSMFVNTFIFMFVAGTFAPRFYMPVLILLAPCIAIYLDLEDYGKHIFSRLVLIALLVAMNLSGIGTSVFCKNSTINEPFRQVVKYLEEEGLTFGVTTFWNTGVINELTDGRIECINVKDENLLEFCGWLTFKKYQNKQTWQNIACDRIFLLLDDDVYEAHREDEMLLDGQLVYDDCGYVIFTYEKAEFVEKYSSYYCTE